MEIFRAVILFILAGLAEIGGGWLVWQWLRNGWAVSWGIVGGGVLFLYGVLPTLQTEPAFGRLRRLWRHLHYPVPVVGALGRRLAAGSI